MTGEETIGHAMLEFEREQARRGLRPSLPQPKKKLPPCAADIAAYAKRIQSFTTMDVALHFGVDCRPISAILSGLKRRGIVDAVPAPGGRRGKLIYKFAG